MPLLLLSSNHLSFLFGPTIVTLVCTSFNAFFFLEYMTIIINGLKEMWLEGNNVPFSHQVQ